MGPSSLSTRLPDAASAYWSQLPLGLDDDTARQLLAELARHVASVVGAPPPRAFDDVRSETDIAAIVDPLSEEHVGPELLGATWEHLMATGDRRVRGAHFTPTSVADAVIGHAFERLRMEVPDRSADVVEDTLTIWDPAAGGGAFLLAAARWLERETSMAKSAIVACLHATDIDQIALEVCSAALELWSCGEALPVVACADALLALPQPWPRDFSAIVGNPPFLGQLTTDTARDQDRRQRLAAAYPDVCLGYVDESALFLHLSLDRVAPGGIVALVLPESVLAARDAGPVRVSADRHAALSTLWVDDGQSFDAAVDVVAPVLVADGETSVSQVNRSTPLRTRVVTGTKRNERWVTTPSNGQWAPLLAAARGVPAVDLSSDCGVVGDLASITAGFRQHFYGIADAVSESDGSAGEHQLVTSGAIDPLRLLWGDRPLKFAGKVWVAPVVEFDRITDEAVRRWFAERAVPKLMVASQTRAIEVVVDAAGTRLPSVPVLSVEPHDEDDLWRLAAILGSPIVSAWMATRSAGSGLAHTAIRIRATELALAPLPVNAEPWSDGAAAARDAQHASEIEDWGGYVASLRTLAEAMVTAYGVDDGRLIDWWWDRLRLPEGM